MAHPFSGPFRERSCLLPDCISSALATAFVVRVACLHNRDLRFSSSSPAIWRFPLINVPLDCHSDDSRVCCSGIQSLVLVRRPDAHLAKPARPGLPDGWKNNCRCSCLRVGRRRTYEALHWARTVNRGLIRNSARARHRHRPHRMLPDRTPRQHLRSGDVSAMGC